MYLSNTRPIRFSLAYAGPVNSLKSFKFDLLHKTCIKYTKKL